MNPKANVNVLSTFNKKRGGLDLIFDPDSGKDTQISESWEFSGMKLYFVLMGSGTSFTLSESKTYLKVITGKLETPALGCFAEPFEIRNTNVKEKKISAGPKGALFAVLLENDEALDNLTEMNQLNFLGPNSQALKWKSFEEKFGSYTDFFDGKDCHMMDGFHLLNRAGKEIVYVNFWSCGQGVNLSTHNHAGTPSEEMPAFAEVHWVINSGTGRGGMFQATETGEILQLDTMSKGDEHGPYFELDEKKNKPLLRSNGAVKYGWHGWQGGYNSDLTKSYDFVAAFEINPDFALIKT
ncbi:MAG: hypothetical protein CMQ39_03655 [Gammaproteobacteria bacterium]|nr:hypothetical protein [Gammaproteobacteria bacterium]